MSGLAEPDPLVIVFGLYAVGIIASRLFFRNPPSDLRSFASFF